MELPAASQVVSPSIDLEVDLAAGSRRSTIVCIDDNPANVALLAALVEDLGGLELVVAPSADIGLELIRSHRPSLVVIDVQLPGMSGFEALRRLRSAAETRAIPVIGLASEASRWDKRRAARAGFARYLAKPLRVDDLVRAMEELLGRDDTPPMSR
ncbi:MAG: response regulator [Polyangiaceae bacterium]